MMYFWSFPKPFEYETRINTSTRTIHQCNISRTFVQPFYSRIYTESKQTTYIERSVTCVAIDICNTNTAVAKHVSSKPHFSVHNGTLLGLTGINSLEICTMRILQFPHSTKSTCISKHSVIQSPPQHNTAYIMNHAIFKHNCWLNAILVRWMIQYLGKTSDLKVFCFYKYQLWRRKILSNEKQYLIIC
jgi:hypothetical protein